MSPATDPTDDATALAAAIRGGEASARGVMEATLAALDARADLGVARLVDAEMGLAAADAFDDLLKRRSRRATHAAFGGVPFLMKDLGNPAKGLTPCAGSPALVARATPAEADSALARRFRRGGLLPFGLSTTPELGLALTSEPRTGPIARNPLAPGYSPGGSSGGAAAAVASGILAIAHATDAAGSTRLPAACCGLAGLKASRGATPNGPDFGNHLNGIASELVVARSLRDIATALTLATGDSEGPFADPDLDAPDLTQRRLRIGLVDAAPGIVAIGDAQASAVHAAGEALAAAGHAVTLLDPERLAVLSRSAIAVVRTILSVGLADWMDGAQPDDEELSQIAWAVVEEGRRMPATAFYAEERVGTKVAYGLWRLFEEVDAIVTPMLSGPPPRIGAFPMDHRDVDLHWQRMATTAPYASLANIGGIPGLSLPHGLDADGLPLSVQILGPIGADRLLLALGETLTAAKPWPQRFPLAGLPT